MTGIQQQRFSVSSQRMSNAEYQLRGNQLWRGMYTAIIACRMLILDDGQSTWIEWERSRSALYILLGTASLFQCPLRGQLLLKRRRAGSILTTVHSVHRCIRICWAWPASLGTMPIQSRFRQSCWSECQNLPGEEKLRCWHKVSGNLIHVKTIG